MLAVKPVSSVPSASMCAMFAACLVPIEANEPPMYQPPVPSEATAFTVPPTNGHGDVTAPVVESSETKLPVSGPM